jgi:ribosomal protein L14E/L6E/L27E
VKVRPLRVGDVVVSIRDVEASNRATVIHEADERGFVLVAFADGIPRSLPIASVERAADKKPIFRPESEALSEATSLGDYLTRIESGISQRNNK